MRAPPAPSGNGNTPGVDEITPTVRPGAPPGPGRRAPRVASAAPDQLGHQRPGEAGLSACGILDFQMGGLGPVVYDLVSLLQDARRDVAPSLAAALVERWRAGVPELDDEAFSALWAVLGFVRHARIVAIFQRLAQRDGKPAYLVHLPRVWSQLDGALAHPILRPLAAWFAAHVPQSWRGPAPALGPLRAASPFVPASARVLAAGLATRMRPLTNDRPKALLAVGGRTMLDRALDHLAAAGCSCAVINAHYLKGLVAAHVEARAAAAPDAPALFISPEDDLLETGGGVRLALSRSLLGCGPFFAINADIIWTDRADAGSGGSALSRLGAAFDDATMDALLLLAPREGAFGYDGPGDFHMDEGTGRLARRAAGGTAAYVFAGVQIMTPGLFDGTPEGRSFSNNLVWDRALGAGRLFGIVHDGGWFHVGDPEAFAGANARLSGRRASLSGSSKAR